MGLIVGAILSADKQPEEWMPTRRAKMRALREVMRMYREGGLPVREIARFTGAVHRTDPDIR